MGLFGLFAPKSKRGPSADRVPLSVLYVTDREGLSAENGFALRDIIIAAAPSDFEFLNPGSFVVFFPGTEDGMACAERLSIELTAFAHRTGLTSFGVGIELGPCFVSRNASGQFTSRPLGETISRAMQTAITGATNAL